MQRADERSQLFFRDILQFVDEHDDSRSGFPGCSGHLLEKSSKVQLKVTVVSEPRFGIEVQTHFDIAVLDLQCLGETSQSAKGARSHSLGALAPTQAKQGEPHLGSEQGGQ